jgi:hypothetical protein
VLLNQQCWVWGQDIRRPEGNLLLEHGFERLRPTAGESGSSQYTLQGSGASCAPFQVRLWGFGMYFGVEQGIFINRFEFVPRVAELADLWQAQQMTQLARAKELSLLPLALRWIACYEQWVFDTQGACYRSACLHTWAATVGEPDELPSLWQQLSRDVAQALACEPELEPDQALETEL